MDFLHAGILGIVEGLGEFLPISSTAHIVFVSKKPQHYQPQVFGSLKHKVIYHSISLCPTEN